MFRRRFRLLGLILFTDLAGNALNVGLSQSLAPWSDRPDTMRRILKRAILPKLCFRPGEVVTELRLALSVHDVLDGLRDSFKLYDLFTQFIMRRGAAKRLHGV